MAKISFWNRLKFLFNSKSLEKYIKDFLAGEDVKFYLNDADFGLKVSTLFACFRILAETFASCPIFEYKKEKGGQDRIRTNDTGIGEILHDQTNDLMSAYNFLEAVMYNINCGGNSVSVKLTNRYGEIIGLFPLSWDRVKIEPTQDGKSLEYTIDNKIKYARQEIFHVPGPSVNGLIGMSILEYSANTIKIAQNFEGFLQNLYKNGIASTGFFEYPSFLKEETYAKLKEHLKKEYAGLQNVGVPILLEGGLKFNQLSIKLVDAEFLANRKFTVEEICRFCRVPLHMVQSLDRATHSNIEQQSLEFIMYTMLPHFKRFEANANMQLLTPQQRKDGYYLEFNLTALVRGDLQSRFEAYSKGRQWGFLSINDIRRLENMPIVEGGDQYLQPLNMVEVGKDTQIKKEIENLLNEKEKRICHM